MLINDNKKPRVVVAMSGGVDSSVAAFLLKKKGLDVIGIFLKLSLGSESGLYKARQTAEMLSIPFYVIDLSGDFKEKVVDYYISEYEKGRTPNPCVVCNKLIKFGLLWDKARGLGADFLATGHYARLRRVNSKFKSQNLKFRSSDLRQKNYYIFRARDEKKDQSYYLWSIDKRIISHLVFPLGNMKKEEVKRIARKAKLPIGERESQGACFFAKGENKRFLSSFAKKLKKEGNIIDREGNILGKHKGLIYYTIGQREGLGDSIAAQWNKFQTTSNGPQKNFKRNPSPLYVIGLDIKKNQLIVGENKDIFTKELKADSLNILDEKIFNMNNKNIYAQVRGGHEAQKCKIISIDKKNIFLEFKKPIRAVTPGQSVVFYDGGQMLGGGVIK